MKKSFISNNIKAVVFDLDGTIYDEFDFIVQVYLDVAKVIADYIQIPLNIVYEKLCQTWLEIGSSGNVFQQSAFELASSELPKEVIKECVSVYRNAKFQLNLSNRAKSLFCNLNNAGYLLCIVTDGDSELQRKKIDSLGLNQWFSNQNIYVSGDYGKEYQKPNPFMGLKLLCDDLKANEVLYLGDRNIDKIFAENVGFSFVQVKNMQSMIL